MNIANALRALLKFVDNVPTDDQLDARLSDGSNGRDIATEARAALAAHDAAVSAGGWSASGHCFLKIDGNFIVVTDDNGTSEADEAARLERIVACVNACQGIADPARLVPALRGIPNDYGMIEHNPDEGMRAFCCGGDVSQHYGRDDVVTHAHDCWYFAADAVAFRAALARCGGAP